MSYRTLNKIFKKIFKINTKCVNKIIKRIRNTNIVRAKKRGQ